MRPLVKLAKRARKTNVTIAKIEVDEVGKLRTTQLPLLELMHSIPKAAGRNAIGQTGI